MSLHPDIQVGSEVATRDRHSPWECFGDQLWRVRRVTHVSPSRRAVVVGGSHRYVAHRLDELHPLTDEIRAEVVHQRLLVDVWARLVRLTSVGTVRQPWPRRLTPEQTRRVSELLTEIETLTEVRAEVRR